ncbi:hypothetical protein EV175_000741 [Coemansia sp. RSA 1933]|nr:hypothetical protein EV175_000741 [Coemansia sp. RSA 1933]
MSSRAVKKLLKESGYDDLAETAAMVESRAKDVVESDEEAKKQNMFDLLMGDDDTAEQESSSSEDEQVAQKVTLTVVAGGSSSRGRRTAKGNGGGRKRKGKKGVNDLKMSELQAHLDQISEQDGGSKGDYNNTVEGGRNQQSKELLAADVKHLDAEAEIRRLFGSAAVGETDIRIGGRKVPRHLVPKRLTLTRPKLTWPPLQHGPGVSVEAIEAATADSATKALVQGDVTGGRWFSVEHNERFRSVQVGFLEAVARNDADAIGALVYQHPYHVDALLQLSEIIKQTGGDFGEAGALVERALYAFEQGFAPRFNIAAGTARVDFRRVESRTLFLALFRHMQFLARRGCWRTAFEVNKILLGLDPARDPLGALVTLDFHALKAAQYGYVEQLAAHWAWAPVDMMPGWAFSRALAAFMLERKAQKKNKKSNQQRSMELLVDAILTFPTAVPVLWAKAGINVDARIVGHPYFDEPQVEGSDSALTHMQLLVQLYVERSCALYRVPEVVQWLQEGLRQALVQIDNDLSVSSVVGERKRQVQSKMCSYVVPENVSRHVLVADMDALKAALPVQVRSAEYYAFDPLPPADNIDPYADFVAGMMFRPEHLTMPGAFGHFEDGDEEGGDNLLQRLLGFVRGQLGVMEIGDPGTSEDESDIGDNSGSNDDDGEEGEETPAAAASGSSGSNDGGGGGTQA